MALSTKLAEALANKDYNALENEWILAADQTPEEIESFVRAAETLDRLGQGDKARTLLEVLDQQLKEKALWSPRLDLLRAAGKRYVKAGTMFDTILATVHSLYEDRQEQLEILLPVVGLDKDRDETPKLWDKIERLRSLLIFEVGTVVAMKGKGVGIVTDVNLPLQTLKVDFERLKGVSVGFRATAKMLDVLPEGHVLRRKLEEPESLEKLKPAALLQQVLQSYERPLSGAEVKEVVAGVVPLTKWTSWWAAARKHPQVLSSGQGKQTYSWAETGADAADAIWQDFLDADLEDRLDHFRRASNQDDELVQKMMNALIEDGRPMLDPASPDLAMGIVVWAAVEKLLPEDSEFKPAEALRQVEDLPALLARVDAPRARDRVYEMIREIREDWLDVSVRRFPQETDARSLRLLSAQVFEHSQEARESLIDRVLAQPSKTPVAFTWLAEQASDDDSLREYRPLRLLKQLLVALGDESFSAMRTRLSVLCDSGGTVPKILSTLDFERMRDAKAAIERARGLEDYRREPLLTSVHLRFPELEVIADLPLYALAESLEAKREELKALLEQEIPENRRAIETAREMGDLRENFEYKSARQRHEYLSARASALNGQLERTIVLRPEIVNPDEIRVGTTVVLTRGDDRRTITILGPWESDPEAGVISHESELAVELLGSAEGELVTIEGEHFEVESIVVYQKVGVSGVPGGEAAASESSAGEESSPQ